MDSGDKKNFLRLMNAVTEYYGRPPMSELVVTMYFSGLVQYSYVQVECSVNRHIAKSEFIPKIANIVKGIEGGEITTDKVLAAARLTDTPMGVLCRIKIGSYDLNNQKDMFYLKQRAEECILVMEEMKAKAANCQYSDHEISMMIKHNVNPCDPFMRGLSAPQNTEELAERVISIGRSDRHKLLLEKPEENEKDFTVADNVSAFLSRIIE